jgi:hypothetical protein
VLALQISRLASCRHRILRARTPHKFGQRCGLAVRYSFDLCLQVRPELEKVRSALMLRRRPSFAGGMICSRSRNSRHSSSSSSKSSSSIVYRGAAPCGRIFLTLVIFRALNSDLPGRSWSLRRDFRSITYIPQRSQRCLKVVSDRSRSLPASRLHRTNPTVEAE